MAILIRDVVLPRERNRLDLRVRNGVIVELAPTLTPAAGEWTVDGFGGRLIPSLIDDHLHVGAWLRAMRSREFPSEGLAHDACLQLAQEGPAATGWSTLFGIDHHHDVSKELAMLDRMVTHPVLLVHRSGHAAFANERGRSLLRHMEQPLANVGACWRIALGPATAAAEDALLNRLRNHLLASGVSRIRDATPYPSGMAAHVARIARALWPVRISFMGHPENPLEEATHLKLFELPATRHDDRPLAVHAVEPEQICCACGVVDARGRIEHASICPESLIEMVAATGCTVCANPGFFVDRAAALGPLMKSGEAQFYQPLAELLDAGVHLTFGSDAPVGKPGPWPSIRGAQQRGRFPGRRLSFSDAVRCATDTPELVTADSTDWLGRRADFAILNRDHAASGHEAPVALTVIDGRLEFQQPNASAPFSNESCLAQ